MKFKIDNNYFDHHQRILNEIKYKSQILNEFFKKNG